VILFDLYLLRLHLFYHIRCDFFKIEQAASYFLLFLPAQSSLGASMFVFRMASLRHNSPMRKLCRFINQDGWVLSVASIYGERVAVCGVTQFQGLGSDFVG
jgi:hypothetical protein